MNRFDTIIRNFVRWGNSTEQVNAALIIGSQARNDHPADEYSDLDLIMVVDEPSFFLESDDWLKQIGNARISFTEDTIGGNKEIRILFDHGLDVDVIIFTQNSFKDAVGSSDAAILDRGYRILIDKYGIESVLPRMAGEKPSKPPYIPLTEWEFNNMANDFWYHAVWSAKKLIRGEVWTAKTCVDSYMKGMLLRLIECHARALHGVDWDTWHNGRFMEEWAEAWIIQKLAGCYAHYEEDDIKKALLSTMDLFRSVAVEVAGKLDYAYPDKADRYASEWVKGALS